MYIAIIDIDMSIYQKITVYHAFGDRWQTSGCFKNWASNPTVDIHNFGSFLPGQRYSLIVNIQTSNRLSSSKNCEIHNLLIPHNINLLIVINLTHPQYHTSTKSNKTKTHLSLYFFKTHPEIYPQHNCNPFERGFHAVSVERLQLLQVST